MRAVFEPIQKLNLNEKTVKMARQIVNDMKNNIGKQGAKVFDRKNYKGGWRRAPGYVQQKALTPLPRRALPANASVTTITNNARVNILRAPDQALPKKKTRRGSRGGVRRTQAKKRRAEAELLKKLSGSTLQN